MKTEISAVRRILRKCTVRRAAHQLATRNLRDAVAFQVSAPGHAAECLKWARFHAAQAEGDEQAARGVA